MQYNVHPRLHPFNNSLQVGLIVLYTKYTMERILLYPCNIINIHDWGYQVFSSCKYIIFFFLQILKLVSYCTCNSTKWTTLFKFNRYLGGGDSGHFSVNFLIFTSMFCTWRNQNSYIFVAGKRCYVSVQYVQSLARMIVTYMIQVYSNCYDGNVVWYFIGPVQKIWPSTCDRKRMSDSPVNYQVYAVKNI